MRRAVEWLTKPKVGETENGDAVVVREEGDVLLLAVVDALGHGRHAAHAAKAAVDYLQTASLAAGTAHLVQDLHEKLRGTRGAAALVCLTSPGRLEGCGVGNVEMRASRPDVPVVLNAGIIGANVKRLRVFHCTLEPRDRVVIFSDGMSSRFSVGELRNLSPRDTCEAIFAKCRRDHDDATVLVADLGIES
jgi:negative regulator of sigma-B (phosphoserine phosphatase)